MNFIAARHEIGHAIGCLANGYSPVDVDIEIVAEDNRAGLTVCMETMCCPLEHWIYKTLGGAAADYVGGKFACGESITAEGIYRYLANLLRLIGKEASDFEEVQNALRSELRSYVAPGVDDWNDVIYPIYNKWLRATARFYFDLYSDPVWRERLRLWTDCLSHYIYGTIHIEHEGEDPRYIFTVRTKQVVEA